MSLSCQDAGQVSWSSRDHHMANTEKLMPEAEESSSGRSGDTIDKVTGSLH